jgi:2-oxoglutarate dehydrogenase E1 component
VVILRIEQLYPFPKPALKMQTDRYPNASTFIWCQDEPKNQGAWYSSQHHIRKVIGPDNQLTYAGRDVSAAPAVGSPTIHIKQQHSLLSEALGIQSEDE